jgi:Histone H1-like nucleoprotein HC2/PADR1 (NUC008) domain
MAAKKTAAKKKTVAKKKAVAKKAVKAVAKKTVAKKTVAKKAVAKKAVAKKAVAKKAVAKKAVAKKAVKAVAKKKPVAKKAAPKKAAPKKVAKVAKPKKVVTPPPPPTPRDLRKAALTSKTVKELKAMLRANDQVTGGTRGELLDRILDCVEHGNLPRCPQCFLGRLRVRADGSFSCPGGYDDDEYKECSFHAPAGAVVRPPWQVQIPGSDV